MKTCPYCADQIQDTATVCKHCGRRLVKKTVPVWTTLSFVLLIASLALYCAFSFANSAPTYVGPR